MRGRNNGESIPPTSRDFDLRIQGISEAVIIYLLWKQPAVINEEARSAALKAE